MQALEITTFRLKGHSFSTFITANKSIDHWLQAQPGFQWRRMLMQGDETVIDMVAWDTVAQGRDAMHRIITETSESPVHEMIDVGSVDWQCLPVAHVVE